MRSAGLRVGMNICYDGGFPESARVLTLLGADLVVLPTNWPPGAECAADYTSNARAMENTIYYVAVNRVGKERGFTFIGRSRICDPLGKTIATADEQSETILYADIDLAAPQQAAGTRRRKKRSQPHLRPPPGDVRPDCAAASFDADSGSLATLRRSVVF